MLQILLDFQTLMERVSIMLFTTHTTEVILTLRTSVWVLWKVDGNSIGHGGECNNQVEPIVPTVSVPGSTFMNTDLIY